MTAEQTAKNYSESVEWVPVVRCKPPTDEWVRVLYEDGVVMVAVYAGGSIFLDKHGGYRYANPLFWQPIRKGAMTP